MPLPPPAARTAQHLRRVTYQGFLREDGLWDIEGELHDSKAHEQPSLRQPGRVRAAGEPIHHLWLRVTVDGQLVVRAIDAAMDAHPLPGCSQAQTVQGAFQSTGDAPPRHLGQCTGWDFAGEGVRLYYPQFHGRPNPADRPRGAPERTAPERSAPEK